MHDFGRFAQDHAVSWELLPHQELRGGALCAIGFDLTLHAQAPTRGAGSEAPAQLHAGLRALVERVLTRDLRWDIEPFDGSLRCRAETAWTPEVELVVEIRHREGTFEPLDAGERARIREIGAALIRLGVPEGRPRRRAA